MHIPVRLFVDFDGTISRRDTTDLLLQRFARPEWEEVEAAWMRGEIGSRECMARQIDLLRVTPQALDDFAGELEVDPAFAAFMMVCREYRVPVVILSDGLDRIARGVLGRIGINVPVISNRLAWLGSDRWRLTFPYSREDCASAAGNCKCARLGATEALATRPLREPAILIGDGRSDFCAAQSAAAVFAKGKLAAHCREKDIQHIHFDGFNDLIPHFRRLMESPLPVAVPAAEVAESRLWL